MTPLRLQSLKTNDFACGEGHYCRDRGVVQDVMKVPMSFYIASSCSHLPTRQPVTRRHRRPCPKVTVRSRGRHRHHHCYHHSGKGNTTLRREFLPPVQLILRL